MASGWCGFCKNDLKHLSHKKKDVSVLCAEHKMGAVWGVNMDLKTNSGRIRLASFSLFHPDTLLFQQSPQMESQGRSQRREVCLREHDSLSLSHLGQTAESSTADRLCQLTSGTTAALASAAKQQHESDPVHSVARRHLLLPKTCSYSQHRDTWFASKHLQDQTVIILKFGLELCTLWFEPETLTSIDFSSVFFCNCPSCFATGGVNLFAMYVCVCVPTDEILLNYKI